MGETKKIVVEHYPVEKLPEELRQGLQRGEFVRITVETEVSEGRTRGKLSDLLDAGPGIYASSEEAEAAIRALRDEWE